MKEYSQADIEAALRALSVSPRNPIRIGTRGSPLALAQAHETRNRLMVAHGLQEDCFSVEIISTAGDRIQDRPLSQVGGKGLFTAEIEEKLLSGELHMAVHSSKDMPTVLPDGLEISTFLPREDVRDAMLCLKANSFSELPAGSVVGTASLRRQAMVRRLRPDLEVVNYRGNVQSRLRKLEEGVVDATLLATAGLNRLGLQEHITQTLDPDTFVPAIGQGAVCIEVHSGAEEIKALLAAVHDRETGICLTTERAFLRELDGSCRTPIAGHARIQGKVLKFHGMVLSADGQTAHEINRSSEIADVSNANALGRAAAATLKSEAGEAFLAEILQADGPTETR